MFRTRFTLLAAIILIATSTYSAEAADLKVAAKSAVSGFQQSLTATLDAMNILEDEHAKITAEINQVGLLAVTKISATLQTDLVALASQYNPKIAASNAALTTAKAKWETVNTLKIQDGFGFLGSSQAAAAKYFLCPPSTLPGGPTWLEIVKRTCNGSTNPLFGARSTKGAAGSTIGGEDWQKGEIGTLNTWDFGKDLEAVLADGYMVAVNLADFDSTRLAIKSETANLSSLTAIYGKAKLDAQAKSEKAIAVTNAATENALTFENNRFEQALEDLELQQAQAESFILAAKRASKDYKSFNKAFTTALQFEFNRVQLAQLADSPWSSITSLRTMNSLIKVIALADLADTIASRYTMANAAKLNASVGNTFTKDPTFSASLKTSKALYSKVIKS